MQIQNNYQPNFGMSMIIENSARKALEEGGLELISRVKKAGEAVADTKYAHLSIGHNALPIIETPHAEKFMRYFEAEEPTILFPEFLNVNTIWAGKESGNMKFGQKYKACIKMENASAAEKAYSAMKNAKSEIERGAIFTRLLDDSYKTEVKPQMAVPNKKSKYSKEIDELYKQYGRNNI